jgi:hypothetical protein
MQYLSQAAGVIRKLFDGTPEPTLANFDISWVNMVQELRSKPVGSLEERRTRLLNQPIDLEGEFRFALVTLTQCSAGGRAEVHSRV